MTSTAELIQNCMMLDLPEQAILSGRYFAKPLPELGVAVWVKPRITNILDNEYMMQLFPAGKRAHPLSRYNAIAEATRIVPWTLYDDYLRYITSITGASEIAAPRFEFNTAPDLLSLRCIIENAIDNWKDNNTCSTK